jgi:hypothetical protein
MAYYTTSVGPDGGLRLRHSSAECYFCGRTEDRHETTDCPGIKNPVSHQPGRDEACTRVMSGLSVTRCQGVGMPHRRWCFNCLAAGKP